MCLQGTDHDLPQWGKKYTRLFMMIFSMIQRGPAEVPSPAPALQCMPALILLSALDAAFNVLKLSQHFACFSPCAL